MKITEAKSFHCVPAIKENYLKEMEVLFADNKPHAIMLDFEDSISDNAKDNARVLLASQYTEIRDTCAKHDVLMGLRINSFDTQWYKDDIGFALKFPDVLKALDPKTDVFIIAHEDPCSEYGIERPLDLSVLNPLSFFILTLLSKARKYGLIIIDGASREFREEYMENFIRECRLEKSWGLDGKISIHPRQIKHINAIFDMQEDRERAKETVKKFESLTDGSAVVTDEKGNMMDLPSLRMYKKLLK